MTKKSLTVFGCSFGDYMTGGLKHVYGDILADRLGLIYQHESRGGGSNERIWRRFWQMEAEGLLKDSLVIVQYTEPSRAEFFAARPPDHHYENLAHWSEEAHLDGTVIRWKTDSYTWQNRPRDRDFMRTYQEHYTSALWADSQFQWRNRQFQLAAHAQGIDIVFLRNRIMPFFDVIDPYAPACYFEPCFELQQPHYRYTAQDTTHMNEQGHGQLALLLHDHILELDLL